MAELKDSVTPCANAVPQELRDALDWGMQELLKRAKQRPKLQNPLLYLSEKLQLYSDTKRNTIEDGEIERIKSTLGNRIGRRAVVFDSYFVQEAACKTMVEVPNSDAIQGNAESAKEEGGVKPDSQVIKTGKDDSAMSSIPTKTESEEFGVTEALFQKHPIFSSIAKETIMQLIKSMESVTYGQGDTICSKGQSCDFSFVLLSGTLKSPTPANELIGIENLLHRTRSETTLIAASEKVVIQKLRRTRFKEILKVYGQKTTQENFSLLRDATLFHTLTRPEIQQLANGIEMKVYGTDDTIFEACDSLAQDFYIIKSGTVDIIDHNVTKTISKGEVFGDEVLTSLDLPCSRRTTAVAKSSRTEVLTISRDSFDRLLGKMASYIKRDAEMYSTYQEEIDPNQVIPNKGRRSRRVEMLDSDSFWNEEEQDDTKQRTSPKRPRRKSEERQQIEREARKIMKSNDYFVSNYDSAQISSIVQAMTTAEIQNGKEIVKGGELSDKMYIVVDGNISTEEKENNESGILPLLFGAKNMIESSLWTQTFTAAHDDDESITCLSITRSSFKRALKDATIKRNSDIMEFLKIKVFKVLTHKELSKLCDIIDFKVYNVGSIIQNKGELIDNMYVVTQGEIEYTKKDGKTKCYKKGDYFSEMALMGQVSSPFTYTVKKKSKVLYVNRDRFVKLLGPLRILITRSPKLYAEFDRRYRGSQNRAAAKVKTTTSTK